MHATNYTGALASFNFGRSGSDAGACIVLSAPLPIHAHVVLACAISSSFHVVWSCAWHCHGTSATASTVDCAGSSHRLFPRSLWPRLRRLPVPPSVVFSCGMEVAGNLKTQQILRTGASSLGFGQNRSRATRRTSLCRSSDSSDPAARDLRRPISPNTARPRKRNRYVDRSGPSAVCLGPQRPKWGQRAHDGRNQSGPKCGRPPPAPGEAGSRRGHRQKQPKRQTDLPQISGQPVVPRPPLRHSVEASAELALRPYAFPFVRRRQPAVERARSVGHAQPQAGRTCAHGAARARAAPVGRCPQCPTAKARAPCTYQ